MPSKGVERRLAEILAAGVAGYSRRMGAYPNMTAAQFKDAMVFSQRVLDRIGDQLLALGVPAE